MRCGLRNRRKFSMPGVWRCSKLRRGGSQCEWDVSQSAYEAFHMKGKGELGEPL